jgi:predicted  nucleic acid-binding Zn-ribbon protein
MKTFFTYVFIAAAVSTAFLGCDTKPPGDPNVPATNASGRDLRQEMRERTDATKASVAEGKDQFVAAVQTKLNQLDQQIAELGAKLGTLSEQAKPEGEKALVTLKEQRAQLGQKFDALKESSQAAWKDVKAGFESAYAELEKAYQNAKAKFQN